MDIAAHLSAVNTALLLMRVVGGLSMAAHGVNHIFGGGKIAGTGRWFSSLGMRNGPLQAWMASITEIGAGLGLAFGVLTPVCAAGFVGVMTVAIVTVHSKNGFFIIKEGWEYAAAIITYAILIATIGPGRFSVDRAFGIDDTLSGWLGMAIAAGGAVVAFVQLAVFYRPVREPQ